jgi:hypothetical protein
MAARVNGGNSQTGWIDGFRFFDKAEAISATTNVFIVGSYGHDNSYFNGEIGEIILHPGYMSDADVDAVNAYLIAKWQPV